MSTLRVEGSHPGLYAWRVGDDDWYDPVVLACALQWPEYVVGMHKLYRQAQVQEVLGRPRLSIAGAVALIGKAPDRLGELLELLIRAEVHDPS